MPRIDKLVTRMSISQQLRTILQNQLRPVLELKIGEKNSNYIKMYLTDKFLIIFTGAATCFTHTVSTNG